MRRRRRARRAGPSGLHHGAPRPPCPGWGADYPPCALQAPVCHTYSSKGQLRPTTGSIVDTIYVGETFNAEGASVLLDVSHRRVGALQVGGGAGAAGAAGRPPAAGPALSAAGAAGLRRPLAGHAGAERGMAVAGSCVRQQKGGAVQSSLGAQRALQARVQGQRARRRQVAGLSAGPAQACLGPSCASHLSNPRHRPAACAAPPGRSP